MHLPTGNTYGRPEDSYMDEITENKTLSLDMQVENRH